MDGKPNNVITIQTPRHSLEIEYYFKAISPKDVPVNKELFHDMCKDGCINFNRKYSCPPFSPDFSNCINVDNDFLVILFKLNLDQLKDKGYREYLKLQIGNAVIKPRVEKLMRNVEKKLESKYFSTGACRLCKPCAKKKGLPCKHSKEMRFSLESTGVDCNKLTKQTFGFPLLWYKNKTAPEYTAVICGIEINKNDYKKAELILKEELSRIK